VSETPSPSILWLDASMGGAAVAGEVYVPSPFDEGIDSRSNRAWTRPNA
jgi:hypothetical protein